MRQSNESCRLGFLSLLSGALLLGAAAPVFAADPLLVCQSGVPWLWPAGGASIPFNPDQGPLGPLTNAQAVALTQQAFDNWGDLASSTASYVEASALPVDVDFTNFVPFLFPAAPDGLSAVVFDDTGQIFDLLFGAGSGVLGFAGPEWGAPSRCEILEGVAFLNGPQLTDVTAAEDVMTHEFGHFSNLAHVELNGQLVPFFEGGDNSGPSPVDTFPLPSFVGTEVIETMYPFYFGTGAGSRTPHADDIAALSTLYPDPSFFASTGSISGTVFAPNETTRLSGVNVIARNVAAPYVDAVSAISGGFAVSSSQSDPFVGTYSLNGLTPGADYVVFVDGITALPGRFSTPALLPLPGPEEFWNADDESNDATTDDPQHAVVIAAVAGSPAAGTDVIFNAPLPGDPLPVGEDGFVELSLPFRYEICGQSFDSVFVNANGNLTFGRGDVDWTESAGEMLAGPPRIAALWDDLSPFNLFTGAPQGIVTFDQSRKTFTVSYTDVPEFPNTGANSFAITLRATSNHIDVDYADLTAADGLGGVSCGGAVTSRFESEDDLSSFAPDRIRLQRQTAVYEVWGGANPNDAAYSVILYNGTSNYEDNWAGPNDTPQRSRNISIPFRSAPLTKYTEIEPAGGDVDYFEFWASGGDTLVAEIVSGQLDTLICLFDPSGALLTLNDDGGVGLLSKLQPVLPEDGRYRLAVSTYPDFDCSGDGNTDPTFGQGRYVLDLFQVPGIVLALSDDGSENVPLGFSFPFNGTSYTNVWVNSNGHLTFGSGSAFPFIESVSVFLSGPPRIAALWDDLNPSAGGTVVGDTDSSSWTIRFIDVPEFFNTGANSFSVTLASDGTVTIEYGSVTAADGLVGLTEGGGAADPGETDLSAEAGLSAVGTTYELFSGGGDDFDLDDETLVFSP